MATIARQIRIEDPRIAAVLLHPTRAEVLACLREPASATEVARRLRQPAARVNHHVKRLRQASLVRRAGSRRRRNLTEVLYQSIARTFVISEATTPGGVERRRFREDGATRPLRNLVALGERLAGDSLVLLDEAARDDRDVSTYATSLDLRFPDAESRAAFLAELLTAVKSLRHKYAADDADVPEQRYRTVIACYPRVGL